MRSISSFLTLTMTSLALSLVACGRQQGEAADPSTMARRSISAAAPQGFSLQHLGRPHDANFRLLSGKDGRPLFKEIATHASQQERLTTQFVEIDDEESLAAHASAWQLAGVSAGLSESERFVSRRLMLLHDVVELDETRGARRAPAEAVYFPYRVYRGWSYEVVCDTAKRELDAGFKARFLIAEGGIEAFSRNYGLKCHSVGLGVQADGSKSIFAKKLEDIDHSFRAAAPVPVLVEWRRIPGRKGHRVGPGALRSGCAGDLGCQPCDTWRFSRLTWSLSDRKPGGATWDADDSAPDIAITLSTDAGVAVTSPVIENFELDWRLRSPLELDAGARLRFSAMDIDIDENDLVLNLELVVPHNAPGGVWDLGAGQLALHGTCKSP